MAEIEFCNPFGTFRASFAMTIYICNSVRNKQINVHVVDIIILFYSPSRLLNLNILSQKEKFYVG